jgi:hypothetical protein
MANHLNELVGQRYGRGSYSRTRPIPDGYQQCREPVRPGGADTRPPSVADDGLSTRITEPATAMTPVRLLLVSGC